HKLPRPVSQELDQRVLAWTQMNRTVAPADLTGVGVNFEVAHPNNGVLRFIFAANQCTHPCQEFLEDEWLNQVIIRSPFQAGNAILGGVLGCEQEDIGIKPLITNALKDG